MSSSAATTASARADGRLGRTLPVSSSQDSIRASTNALGIDPATCGSTSSLHALYVLQPLRPVFSHNQPARSAATLQMRLSRRFKCPWHSQRPRRSTLAVLRRFSRAALESTSSGRLLLLYLSCRHPSCYKLVLDTAPSATPPGRSPFSALGGNVYTTLSLASAFASTTLSAPHAASSGFPQPTPGLLPPPVRPEMQTAADRTSQGCMSTGIGQHSDVFTSWSHQASATNQCPWTETTEVFVDEGPSVHGGSSAFGGISV